MIFPMGEREQKFVKNQKVPTAFLEQTAPQKNTIKIETLSQIFGFHFTTRDQKRNMYF